MDKYLIKIPYSNVIPAGRNIILYYRMADLYFFKILLRKELKNTEVCIFSEVKTSFGGLGTFLNIFYEK